MSKPDFFDPKYDGLSPEEHIRQHDRDKTLSEINERLKNGGLTDNEKMWNDALEYARSGGRVAPFYLILTLIIGVIVIVGPIPKPSIGLYIIASGFIVEGIGSFMKRRKNGKGLGIYQIIFFVISIAMIAITFMPVSTLKMFLPVAKSDSYTLLNSGIKGMKIDKVYVDGEEIYSINNTFDIKKHVTIKVEYYDPSVRLKDRKIETKTVIFNPKEYFDKLEKTSKIDGLIDFYNLPVGNIL